MNRFQQRLRRISRRQWIVITFVSIILIAIVSYIVYSTVAWTRYQDRAQSFERSSFETIDAALALPSEDKQQKLASFKAAVLTMQKTTPGLCDRPTLAAWQTSLSVINDKYAKCEARATYMRQVSESADNLVRYLESERQLGAILSTAQSQSAEEVTEDQAVQYVERWSQARQAIEALSGPSEFIGVKDAAVTYADNLSKRWQAVVTADEAEDKQLYAEARAKLASAYATKPAITDKAGSVMQQLLKRFNDRYTAK